MNDIFRDLFLAFVRVHLLHHAGEAPIYGLEMIEELGHHGYQIGPGTVYPVLHELQEAGYLTVEPQTVNGKVRKYYRITSDGRSQLAAQRKRWKVVDETLHAIWMKTEMA